MAWQGKERLVVCMICVKEKGVVGDVLNLIEKM
jgi:hypothetical protein